METGVARRQIDLSEYRDELERRLGPSRTIIRQIIHRVARDPKRIIFAKADDPRVMRALEMMVEDRIAKPVVLGDEATLRAQAEALDVKLDGVEFVSLSNRPSLAQEAQALLERRGRRGMTGPMAKNLVATDATVAGLMMVREGYADGLVAGLQHGYPATIRLALQLIGLGEGRRAAVGVHVIVTKRGPLFFADTTVNLAPDAATLADIAHMTARFARELGVVPHVAMLSFANFGTSRSKEARTVADAVQILHGRDPDLDVDGEMQAQIALDPVARGLTFPQSTLTGEANVLIFPNLAAGNTSYQLLGKIAGVDAIGPVLLGLRKPVTVVPHSCSVETIVQMTAMMGLQAMAIDAPWSVRPEKNLPATSY
jgi:malate dehydrogenase (oxaloacetate-decarboxylating)(NADP+)